MSVSGVVLALLLVAVSRAQFEPLNYTQTQLWFDGQIINHQAPLQNASTFRQRYWVIEDFYDPKTGPIFLYICGEWSCTGAGTNSWPVYLAKNFNGLLLTLEHRYYGQSQPYGDESF